jgi:hypothetical protein
MLYADLYMQQYAIRACIGTNAEVCDEGHGLNFSWEVRWANV